MPAIPLADFGPQAAAASQLGQVVGVAASLVVVLPLAIQAAKYAYLSYQNWKSDFLKSREFKSMIEDARTGQGATEEAAPV
jgi:hypothetical protein